MGLFSKFGKNKQQSPEDSGYYRAADDRALTERARSKRASSEAGAVPGASRRSRKDAPDPVLPEKKRARRRLVGAIALALAVAIGLPMVLDSEPKPLANDIAIQIPSKDKPSDATADATPAAAETKPRQADALDQSEEIVEPADEPKEPVKVAAREVKPAVAPEPKVAEHKPELKLDTKPEAKPEPKHESKPEPKKEAEPKKLAEAKPEPKKPEPKQEAKPEPKHEAKPDDASRALAILEGKPAAAPADGGRYVIQVAALSAKDKVDELQGKLRDAGIKSFTQKSPSGDLTRVKVGPFGSREEAEKAKAKLQKIGLSGSLIPA